MNICGIICEYNPFHNGHSFHIEETKKALDCGIVCVMSGNYVQRGDIAVLNKTARAEAAIRCGADLVIELPLPWAVATAERFSSGAVSLLDSLGSITHLSFGAEYDNLEQLQKAAEILCSDSLNELIPKYSSSGITFAAAREKAMNEIAPELSSLLTSPNNILAIEYLKALKKRNSSILPYAVKRTGADHDSSLFTEETASASLIREMIFQREDFSAFLPKASHDIYNREKTLGHTLLPREDIDRIILASLKRLSPEEISLYSDVSEGLEFRLFDAIKNSKTLTETEEIAKTKRYPLSRIRRCLLTAFLGVEHSLCMADVPYARILSFNDTGREILSSFKKSSFIPLITKPASIKKEDEKLYKLLALENRADDIYSLFMKNPIEQGNTFRSSPIYIEES